jgi:hypothetical protein
MKSIFGEMRNANEEEKKAFEDALIRLSRPAPDNILDELDIRDLPTKEKYHSNIMEAYQTDVSLFSEPIYLCPKCNGGMCRDYQYVRLSYPPRYFYKCNKCEYEEFEV